MAADSFSRKKWIWNHEGRRNFWRNKQWRGIVAKVEQLHHKGHNLVKLHLRDVARAGHKNCSQTWPFLLQHYDINLTVHVRVQKMGFPNTHYNSVWENLMELLCYSSKSKFPKCQEKSHSVISQEGSKKHLSATPLWNYLVYLDLIPSVKSSQKCPPGLPQQFIFVCQLKQPFQSLGEMPSPSEMLESCSG